MSEAPEIIRSGVIDHQYSAAGKDGEPQPVIEVHKLVKRFGLKTILKGLNFKVMPGEFVAILGPNGAGKTTFLRILASLSRPTMGDVRIAGHLLPSQAAAVRRSLGVVSHQPLLYGDLTAE
jgi:heme exporter protein A